MVNVHSKLWTNYDEQYFIKTWIKAIINLSLIRFSVTLVIVTIYERFKYDIEWCKVSILW